MTEQEFNKKCENHGLVPPARFYSRFVADLENRRDLDFSFFEMLRKFTRFEDPNSLTVCKMVRFVREISMNKDLERQADWASLLGQLIGKRMQKKIEEYRDFGLSLGQPVKPNEFIPGEI